MSKNLDVNTLDNAALEALLAQAQQVLAVRTDPAKAAELEKKAAKAARKVKYTEDITPLVSDMLTQEEVQVSQKSAWVGRSMSGLKVIVDGQAFTVSLTITDEGAKAQREIDLKIAEAEALKATREAAAEVTA